MQNDSGQRVFLSYASEDATSVEQLYDELRLSGLRPWMDRRDLIPGQVWDREIWRAVTGANVILACLSTRSVRKRGYVQREIKKALDLWEEKLEDDIFLIPVRLDRCDVPDLLRRFQYVDLFAPEGLDRLRHALRKAASQHPESEIAVGAFRYTTRTLEESDADKIAYTIGADYPEFIHGGATAELDQINKRLAGFIIEMVFECRRHSLSVIALPEERDLRLRDDWRRDELRTYFTIHTAAESFLSIEFSVMNYGAGAAHPYTHTRTFNFLLTPLIELSLIDLFTCDSDQYLGIASAHCISQLEAKSSNESESTEYCNDGWIRQGAGPSEDHFRAWLLLPGAMRVIFDPYQVGSYGDGRHEVDVPLSLFNGMLSHWVPRELW